MNKTTIYTGLAAAVAPTLLLTGCTADGELDIDQITDVVDEVTDAIDETPETPAEPDTVDVSELAAGDTINDIDIVREIAADKDSGLRTYKLGDSEWAIIDDSKPLPQNVVDAVVSTVDAKVNTGGQSNSALNTTTTAAAEQSSGQSYLTGKSIIVICKAWTSIGDQNGMFYLVGTPSGQFVKTLHTASEAVAFAESYGATNYGDGNYLVVLAE